MFAGQVAAIEEVPQFGALAAGVPTAEFVAQGQNPLLRAGLVLVAAGAAEDGVELPAGDGIEQRLGLQGVPGAVGAFAQATVVDVVLDLRHREVEAVLLCGLVSEADDLVEVVSGVDVEESERDLRRPERLRGEVEDGHGVLAAGEEQHGAFEFGGDLTDDVDRFGFEDVEGGQARARVVGGCRLGGGVGVVVVLGVDAHVWSPHSVLVDPAQRPARGSSPSATGRVQGWQPIDGYPCDSSGLTGTSKARE